VISAEASSFPASTNFCSESRLMTAKALRFGFENPIRQPHVKRHLPALVGVNRHARARLLPLDAAAGGLALARARAARDPLALARGAGVVAQFVQLHVASP
jgi:hypothetical protein